VSEGGGFREFLTIIEIYFDKLLLKLSNIMITVAIRCFLHQTRVLKITEKISDLKEDIENK